MKRTAIVCALAVLLSMMPLVTVKAETVTVSARSAILMEVSTGEVLFEKDADTKRPMASTTKLMTALLAAAEDWEQTVCFTADMIAEGSSLGLRVGDTLSLRDAVCAMLLCSGNDAANAVALTVADSYADFAAAMNEKAQSLGMHSTTFVTPSGLDADEHESTARDMARLGAAVLQDPVLAAMCKQKQASVTVNGRAVTVTNHNRLLSLYADAVGLKTGFTKKAGRCLVSAATRDGVTLVAVTLHAPDDWDDHTALFEYGFAQRKAVAYPKVALPSLPLVGGVERGVALRYAPPADRIVSTATEEEITAVLHLPPFAFAPIKEGEVIGWVEYRSGGESLLRCPVLAGDAVEARPIKNKKERFRQYVRLLWIGFFQ